MISQAEKERVIAENYSAFEAMLPILLQEHPGEYALMRDGQVLGFFPSASAAQLAGAEKHVDGRFSVQKVESRAIDLGFYSYARYHRAA